MSIFKTDAISLGRTDYSNTSQIITFYTRDFGKIKTLAKGFKRTSAKHSSKAIDLLSYYRILFVKKEHTSLHILTDAILQENYSVLRHNIDSYFKASGIAELIQEFTVENDPSEKLFDLFLNTLQGLSTNTNEIVRFLTFEIKMLQLLGFLPEWKYCVNCRKSIQDLSRTSFNAKEGGVLCQKCHRKFDQNIIVHSGAMIVAERLASINVKKIDRLKIHLSICIEIDKMLRYYINSLLNKNLNSWRYMNFALEGSDKT